MKTIESRLKDIEIKVKPDNSKAIVFVMDEYDGINGDIFWDDNERDEFINWRAKLFREENKYNPDKVYVYLMDEKDVYDHLEEFWISQ